MTRMMASAGTRRNTETGWRHALSHTGWPEVTRAATNAAKARERRMPPAMTMGRGRFDVWLMR